MKGVTDRITTAAGQTTPRFSVLRELAVHGPMTVSAIARVRRSARQGVQRLAAELEADGLLSFAPNPRHRRSPLLTLTREGRGVIDRLLAQEARIARRLAPSLDAARLRVAIDVLREFGEQLER
jgi:DNA-binding MarR family transcriptional regulator